MLTELFTSKIDYLRAIEKVACVVGTNINRIALWEWQKQRSTVPTIY